MTKKKKTYITLIFLMALCLMLPLNVSAAKKVRPKPVTLTSVSSPDYNKVKISWKKVSGATHYKIYYRKHKSKKWIGIKTVSGKSSSYTHTSSSKRPIIIGQKYDYTVRGYNKKYKTYGKYNTRGLIISTKPQTVKLTSATYDEKTGGVNISWKKSDGADKYIVYCRTKDNSEWIYLGNTTETSYFDEYPFGNQYNTYTVAGYTERNSVLGQYDSKGVSVFVPGTEENEDNGPIEQKPELTEEQFAAEIFRLTNIERAKHGAPLVQTNDALKKVAMIRAKELSIKFDHFRPDGTLYHELFSEYGIPADNGGENIAAKFGTPQDVVNGWMNSQGHRVTLLNDNSTHLGVGVYKSGPYYYMVQIFTAYGQKEKLTIDANGGYFPTLNNVSVHDMYFYHGTHVKFNRDVPTPVREGYTFNGWTRYDMPITGMGLTCNETIVASWIKN